MCLTKIGSHNPFFVFLALVGPNEIRCDDQLEIQWDCSYSRASLGIGGQSGWLILGQNELALNRFLVPELAIVHQTCQEKRVDIACEQHLLPSDPGT
jgi:hypothetical protein